MSEDHLHALPSGYQLHEYQLERVLGIGGFGITYLARDTLLKKPVAIKEYLPAELAIRHQGNYTVAAKSASDQDDYEWGLSRFLDEASTLAQFDHPNVNRVYRLFEGNGTAYIVLDYVEGQTLSSILKNKGRLSETELKRLLKELLSGLELVHEADFVHRDIKPGNIMIRPNGSAVLLDFGAARQAIGQRSKSLTSILTPGYAPIEQYVTKGKPVGPWSDIYSLGMVAYRCISGEGDAALVDAVTRATLEHDGEAGIPPAIEVGKVEYSEGLLKAIDWAIMVREKDRPQGTKEWEQALFLDSTKPPRVGKSSSPLLKWVVVGIVILGAVGAGGWWMWQQQPEQVRNDIEDARKKEIARQQEEKRKAEEAAARQAELDRQLEEQRRAQEEAVRQAEAKRKAEADRQAGLKKMKPAMVRVQGRSFYIGKTEVTQAQWRAVMGDNPSHFSGCDNCPVESVSWDDVQTYIKKLNQKTGSRYRLPSAAEWEYACRGGRSNEKYCGGNDAGSVGWYEDNSGDKTHPVGQKQANSYGLYDMSGNVREWTQDCYVDDCSRRVLRGGSWFDEPDVLRSGVGLITSATDWASDSGFRLAQDL